MIDSDDHLPGLCNMFVFHDVPHPVNGCAGNLAFQQEIDNILYVLLKRPLFYNLFYACVILDTIDIRLIVPYFKQVFPANGAAKFSPELVVAYAYDDPAIFSEE